MRPASFSVAVALVALALSACSDNLTPPSKTSDTRLACVPNLDGQIDYAELKVGYDVPVTYLAPPAGQSRTVDVVGEGEGESKVWDWATDDASDQLARISAGTLADKWFASAFPNGQFTVPADLGGTLLAINSIDATGMYIHGFASTEEDPAEGRTLYTYDPPIRALSFPLKDGRQWTSTATVRNGIVRGLPYASTETYDMRVDATGTLKLPDVTFEQVQRVSSLVTIRSAVGPPVTQRQVAFYFECFGEVARATSNLLEPSADFTLASEVRRFSLAKTGRDSFVPADPTPLACSQNLDGKIDSKELKVGYDLPVNYLVAPAGTTQAVSAVTGAAPAGDAHWSFNGEDPSNQIAQVSAGTLAGKWFAAEFPAGQFAVPADLGGTLLAINSIDANGMYIHGFASAEKNPAEGQTLYKYDPPIKALAFPLKKGAQWTSTATVRHGKVRGIAYASRETYDMKVDAMGTLELPDVTFQQVMRVNSLVTITPVVGSKVTQRQIAFYSECYGEVARATSQLNEADPTFALASEVRRLAPPNHSAFQPAPPATLACSPNADGQLAFEEIKVGFDLPLPLLVPPAGSNPNVSIVTGGDVSAWDWSAPYGGEQIMRIAAGTVSDRWFAYRFPKGQFSVPADLTGKLVAINSLDSTGMYIHGFASANEYPVKDRIIYAYEAPVQVLKFPLKKGDKWTSVGKVRNELTAAGDPYNADDTYEMEVDSVGTLRLPDLTFAQAYRLRTVVKTQLIPGPLLVMRQVAFYSECFGEVARATSGINEPSFELHGGVRGPAAGAALKASRLRRGRVRPPGAGRWKPVRSTVATWQQSHREAASRRQRGDWRLT
ncbi:MAG: hypothetical protein QM765_22800 [Myxococcales bacterium]